MSDRTESIRRRLARDYAVIAAPHELDELTAPAFAARVREVGDDNTEVVVDLRELRFCGSKGIAVLLELHRELAQVNSDLVLSAPPPHLDHLLHLCGLEDHFAIRRPASRRERRLGGADPSRR